MAHQHSHSHHGHSHAPEPGNRITRAFLLGTVLNVSFVIVEAGAGFWTQSLALLADAGHNLSDVLGLLLAWGARTLAQRPPSQRYTYGWRRSSILAALINAIVLLVAMGGIIWEATRRLANPTDVPGLPIIIVAAIGVAINTFTALLFVADRRQDLNLRGAFWHMAADALVSVGVVLAGVAIWATGWLWFDPVVSLIVAAVIIVGTWQLLRESANLVLDGVPAGIDPRTVRLYLAELPGVSQVHDLHIWALSSTETALTAHLVMPEGVAGDRFLHDTTRDLQEHFNIDHATLQLERGNPAYPCELAPEHRV